MTLEAIANGLFGALFMLLAIRLLVLTWAQGGAFVALGIVFLYLLLAYGPIEAMIGGFLMLIAAPALGRSGFGAIVMGVIRGLTDPLVGAMRAATGGRAGEGLSILLAIVAIWAVRIVFLLPALRQG